MLFFQTVPEVDKHVRRILKYAGLLMVIFCIWAFFFPEEGLFYGLLVGLGIGIFNVITLAKRIKNLPTHRPDMARRSMGWGLTMRFGLIMVVLFWVQLKFPIVNLFGVIAGLLIPYAISSILSIIDNCILYYKKSNGIVKKYYTE